LIYKSTSPDKLNKRKITFALVTFEFDRPGVAYISVYAHHPGSYKITATIEKDIIQQLTLNQEKNDFVTKGQWKCGNTRFKLFIISVRSAIIVIYFWFGILFDI
jgi:hypothetical protein